MKLEPIKVRKNISEVEFYKKCFNEACSRLVLDGQFKSQESARNSITYEIKKRYNYFDAADYICLQCGGFKH